MKKSFVFLFLFCVLVSLHSFSQNTSGKSTQNDPLVSTNSKAVELNNKASDLQMAILGLKVPRDSSIAIERLLKKAIQLDPNYRIAYINLWEHYKMNKQFQKAIEISSKWLKNKPKDVDFRLKRAVINDFMNNRELSKADYNFVTGYFSEHPLPALTSNMSQLDKNAILSRAFTTFLITGSKDSSIASFQSLLKLYPNDEQIVSANKKFDTIDRVGYLHELLGLH